MVYKFKRDALKGQRLSIWKKNTHENFSKHWHSYYEIIHYRNCRGVSVLNGETFPITESCLFLLTPKDFHDLQVQDTEESVSYVLSFSETMILDTLFGEINKGPVYIGQVSQRLSDMIADLYEIYKGTSVHKSEHIRMLFNCILIEILEHGSKLSRVAQDINPMIRESISLMMSDPAQPWSLHSFSQRFNVSPAYFSRLFHEDAGIAFKQYQTILRIEYAKRLLEERKLPIIDVGSECGFNTPSQFVRAFKQLTGMTPSAYRGTLAERL